MMWRIEWLPVVDRPIEPDRRIVPGDALLIRVLRIVGLGGVIDQLGWRVAEHLVSVGHARGDLDHLAAPLAEVDGHLCVAGR